MKPRPIVIDGNSRALGTYLFVKDTMGHTVSRRILLGRTRKLVLKKKEEVQHVVSSTP